MDTPHFLYSFSYFLPLFFILHFILKPFMSLFAYYSYIRNIKTFQLLKFLTRLFFQSHLLSPEIPLEIILRLIINTQPMSPRETKVILSVLIIITQLIHFSRKEVAVVFCFVLPLFVLCFFFPFLPESQRQHFYRKRTERSGPSGPQVDGYWD